MKKHCENGLNLVTNSFFFRLIPEMEKIQRSKWRWLGHILRRPASNVIKKRLWNGIRIVSEVMDVLKLHRNNQ